MFFTLYINIFVQVLHYKTIFDNFLNFNIKRQMHYILHSYILLYDSFDKKRAIICINIIR